MSILKSILMAASSAADNGPFSTCGFVPYGKNRRDGGHDHRYNRGADRTPAQRKADANRTK
ncbi:hypothetical protein ACFPU0_02920 [Pseudomonas sp. GCM10022186]|uniref:hypothetical protein n=1 Tax=Pseudomonas sp. GCM10022186 TaxID=3252650 RepID=UPI00361747C4